MKHEVKQVGVGALALIAFGLFVHNVGLVARPWMGSAFATSPPFTAGILAIFGFVVLGGAVLCLAMYLGSLLLPDKKDPS